MGARGYIQVHGAKTVGVYSGEVLSTTYLAIATHTSSSSLSLQGGHVFKIQHVMIGATPAGDNGFKLDYSQIPCGVVSGETQQTP